MPRVCAPACCTARAPPAVERVGLQIEALVDWRRIVVDAVAGLRVDLVGSQATGPPRVAAAVVPPSPPPSCRRRRLPVSHSSSVFCLQRRA